MNNEHRVSLISFCSKLCRHFGMAVPAPDDLIQTLNNIMVNYFNTPEGCFWIFYNSDVAAVQEIDGSQYMYTPTGEHLDDSIVTFFSRDDFSKWNKRVNCPLQFTEEETQFLLSRMPNPVEIIWPVLMWCASPSATDWRLENNPICREVMNFGTVVEYNGRIMLSDDVQIIGSVGGDCSVCGETLACVFMTNDEEIICEHCKDSDHLVPCSLSHTCVMYSCIHNSENGWPIAAAGRRFHARNTSGVQV